MLSALMYTLYTMYTVYIVYRTVYTVYSVHWYPPHIRNIYACVINIFNINIS